MDFEDWCEILDATITNRLGARFVETTKQGATEWGWRYGSNVATVVLDDTGTEARILINGKEDKTFSLLAKPEWVGETIAGLLASPYS